MGKKRPFARKTADEIREEYRVHAALCAVCQRIEGEKQQPTVPARLVMSPHRKPDAIVLTRDVSSQMARQIADSGIVPTGYKAARITREEWRGRARTAYERATPYPYESDALDAVADDLFEQFNAVMTDMASFAERR